jgi:hypothetical protein
MADDHINETSHEANNALSNNARIMVHELGDQNALANILTNILGKTQELQMDILEHVIRATVTAVDLGNFKNLNHLHVLELKLHLKKKTR